MARHDPSWRHGRFTDVVFDDSGLHDISHSAGPAPTTPPAPAAWIEWSGAFFGVVGSLLLAIAVHPAWGFASFAVSNAAWIVVSLRRKVRALLVQTVVFALTTVIGLWNWWLGPLLLG